MKKRRIYILTKESYCKAGEYIRQALELPSSSQHLEIPPGSKISVSVEFEELDKKPFPFPILFLNRFALTAHVTNNFKVGDDLIVLLEPEKTLTYAFLQECTIGQLIDFYKHPVPSV